MERDNLTSKQLDYAVFLPALSGFYATYVGKQRFPDANGNLYVETSRIPSDFETGVEGLNWLNKDAAYFSYHWALYSAGHAELDVTKHSPKEDMVRNRDRANSFILGDSGGFQIGKGVWEGEWRDPNSPAVLAKMADCQARKTETRTIVDKNGKTKTVTIDLVKEYQAKLDAAQKKREQVLAWMDAYMDYGMILDIPGWISRSPQGRIASGIETFEDAVQGTYVNNDYFMKHRTGACKFLNVLQGEDHDQAEDWYQRMKKYCDPNQYDKPFNGWAMGGQNMCDVHLILKRLVILRHDNLLQPGLHDWMHFLGTSKLEWACLLTDIQRAVRKYINPNFTISFDCASPFLASANGQIYVQTEIEHESKWTYRMVPSVDNKKYAKDTRRFGDAVLQDGVFKAFTESPISSRCLIKDVCIYDNGDLNKIGKEGKTSWDSFSYAIQMGHNVWSHITAVQTANKQYTTTQPRMMPAMLNATSADKKAYRDYGINDFRDVVDLIFSTSDKDTALELIEAYSEFWMDIPGTRGNIGEKTRSAQPLFNQLFEEVQEPRPVQVIEEWHRDDSGLDETQLDNLENELGA
jgi:hypothetical protein